MDDGDVVTFDYELWVEGQETLYDTTIRDAAEHAGILQPNAFYGPVHYVLGSGRMIPGLDRALRRAEIGKPLEIQLDPVDGYGERDPKMIETIPLPEFKKNDVAPEPGLVITYRNRRGVVTTVGAGRVRVDFNPPLAGKKLKYHLTVKRVARDAAEKVADIFSMHFPTPLAWKSLPSNEGGQRVVTVHVPEEVALSQHWVLARYRALRDIERYAGVDRVKLIEEFNLSRPPKEPSKSEATAAASTR